MSTGTLLVGAAIVVACGVILVTDRKYGLIACALVLALAILATALMAHH